MNTFRYDEQKRRLWVSEKNSGTKSVKQICKEAGISRATLYNWISEFPDATEPAKEQPQAVERKGITEEDYELSNKYEMLSAALGQVDVSRQIARKLVPVLVKRFTITVAQACAVAGISEEAYGYKPRKPEVDDQLVYDELSRLIAEDRGRGFLQCYEILQRTHPSWTRKQIKRVYKIGKLYLKRTRVRRNRETGPELTERHLTAEQPQLPSTLQHGRLSRPDATWNLGYIEEKMNDGNVCWMLYLTDDADQAPLNAQTGTGGIAEEHILNFLSRAVGENGKPKKLRVPVSHPLNTREITRWIWENKVALHSLSMAKEENQLAVQQADERVRAGVFGMGLPGSPGAFEQQAEQWLKGQKVEG